MDNQATYHVPVLLGEAVDALNLSAADVCVDLTFGGGGHSREILRRLGPNGQLLAFDRDEDARLNVPADPRLTFVWSDFRYLRNFLRYHGVERVDGILADLGVSWHHFDNAQRGFSFRFDGPLDMRMNQRAPLTAADVVNDYTEEQLTTLFRLYGELRNARQLATALCKARQSARIDTIEALTAIIGPLLPKDRNKKDLAKAFQALRMEVNGELDALHEMLNAAINVLRPRGRLVIITYHSLEDRLVKNFMRAGNAEGQAEKDLFGHLRTPLRPLGKPITPDEEEIARNPRSRSAKLRVAERLDDDNE